MRIEILIKKKPAIKVKNDNNACEYLQKKKARKLRRIFRETKNLMTTGCHLKYQ